MSGHGGERMVPVWVLDDKGEKEPVFFWLMDMNLEPTQCINYTDVIGMGIHV